MERSQDTLILFDIDGTLTKPRNKVLPDMVETLKKLKPLYPIAIVGGSDLPKQVEQLGEEVVALFDYTFSENGLYTRKNGELIHKESIGNFLGEAKLQKFVNFCLLYIASLELPVKRGTFVEYRNGLINVSPIGRNCTQEEREKFDEYNKEHKVLQKMKEVLDINFKDYNLKVSIGGQISADVFPVGWDKTYCLRFCTEYKNVYFFGDRTYEVIQYSLFPVLFWSFLSVT